MARIGPIHIDIEDETYLNYTPSSTSRSSKSSYSSSYTISPISNQSYSPDYRIPRADRIFGLATDVLPLSLFEEDLDNVSLPLSVSGSDISHSTNSTYNNRNMNVFCYIVNFINIFIFFIFSIINKRSVESINPYYHSLIFYSISSYPECKDMRYKIWKLVSYSFVHSNIMHLIGNTLGICFVSLNLYKFQKIKIILLCYLLCVISGALSFYITDPYNMLIGASGGVYGIAGSNISNYIYNSDDMYLYEIFYNRSFVFLFIIIDLLTYSMLYSETVAYQVHWYCFLFGILIGFSIFNYKKKEKYKKYIRFISILIFCYMNSLVLYNYILNYPSEYSLNYFKIIKEKNCCYEYLNFNKNGTFNCQYIIENKFLS